MPAAPTRPEIEAALKKVLASGTFSEAELLRDLLSYIVTNSHDPADHGKLKQTTIKEAVFPRAQDDSIVRTRVGDLRKKLEEYYQGRKEPIEIQVPKGHYVARFVLRRASRLNWILALVLGGVLLAAAGYGFWYFWLARPRLDLTSTDPSRTFQPIVNLAWWNYRQDFGAVPKWSANGVSRHAEELDRAFERLKASGVRGVVWFLFADGSASPDFDANGFVTGLSPAFWEDYDRAIELARKHDISIIWVLIDHRFMFPPEEQKGASLGGHADVIENADKRESFLRKALVPLLRRHPHDRHIAGWILINEPEVALQKGYAQPENVTAFVREAARLVKANTHQPVSISHQDLESFLQYRAGTSGSPDFDFYEFHHYRSCMPPPATRLRKYLPNAGRKPIYIGEFSLGTERRVADLEKLAGGMRELEYAGLWPWALRPDPNEPPKFSEIHEIAARIESHRRASPSLGTQWWSEHARTVVVPLITKDIAAWKQELPEHEKGITDNDQWRGEAQKYLSQAEERKPKEEAALTQATQQHQENETAWQQSIGRIRDHEVQLAKLQERLTTTPGEAAETRREIATAQRDLQVERENENKLHLGTADSRKWVNNATDDLEQTKKEIAHQKANFNEAQRRLWSHRYLLEATQANIRWAKTLYIDWSDELAQR